MNSIVSFDYKLDYHIIQHERNIYNFSNIDKQQILRIAKGKLYIFFEGHERNFIIIESAILDYIRQIKMALNDIENGNLTAFSISTTDWYSNNFRFTYNQNSNSLKIYDMNDEDFDIQINYDLFKGSFNKFSKNFIEVISDIYPDLKNSSIFTDMKKNLFFYF